MVKGSCSVRAPPMHCDAQMTGVSAYDRRAAAANSIRLRGGSIPVMCGKGAIAADFSPPKMLIWRNAVSANSPMLNQALPSHRGDG